MQLLKSASNSHVQTEAPYFPVLRHLRKLAANCLLSLGAVCERQRLGKYPQPFHFGDPMVGDIISLQKSSLGILINKVMS